MSRISIAIIGALFGAVLGASAQAADAVKTMSIITMNDTPQLLEVKEGLIQGLAAHGYTDGKNLKIDFKSAQGNFGTAQQIVRQFIGDKPGHHRDDHHADQSGGGCGDQRYSDHFHHRYRSGEVQVGNAGKASRRQCIGNFGCRSDRITTQPRQGDSTEPQDARTCLDPSLDNARSTVESVKELAPEDGIQDA